MISVVNSQSVPHLESQFREWVEAEWGEVDPFDGTLDGFLVPPPILAIDGEELVAGLAFTSHSLVGSEVIGVWVNVLLVKPEYRGKGIASQLVKAAEASAENLKIEELYAYTQLPHLYLKLGWSVVHSDGESTSLKKRCYGASK